MSSQSTTAKALRFCVVGGASSLLYAAIAVVLVSGLQVSPKLASVFSYLGSLPLNFVGNRRFTFQSGGAFYDEAFRFIALHATGAAVAFASMSLATDYLGGHYLIGVVFAVVLVPAVNFVVANAWVFRAQRRD